MINNNNEINIIVTPNLGYEIDTKSAKTSTHDYVLYKNNDGSQNYTIKANVGYKITSTLVNREEK